MKILLLGKNGQVGWELQRSLAPLGEVLALDRHSSGGAGDLAQPNAVAQTVVDLRPDVVVNAAAYTAVDKAQAEPELARTVNALAPAAVARAAQQVGAWLLHFSTDYVFNGQGQTPWREGDATGPLNVYGQTKLEGEQHIQSLCPQHLIVRTSWVYAARGGNFAKTMLRLAQEREQLSVVSDQVGAPTGADLLADLSAHLLRSAVGSADLDLAGVYHACAAGETTWYDYAQYVFAQAQAKGVALKVAPSQVQPVASSAYPTAAQRPLNSRLDCTRLQATFGLHLPHWQLGVQRMLAEIL